MGWLVLILIVALLGGGAWRYVNRSAKSLADVARAISVFAPTVELGESFRRTADALGKPRGLTWVKCELGADVRFAGDLKTGELFALAPVTISFAAIPGGGMEEVEAVGNLRAGTAIFVWRRGSWQTDGRAVFNLEPAETLAKYAESLQEISARPPTS
jgi:hypothetical protein